MESNNELKEIDIKNSTCYYFDDIMRVGYINFSDILLRKKLFENISIYDISYKAFMGAKPLCIWLEKIDGYVKIYDGVRYLVLFAPERYNAIYDRISYLISQKSGIKYSINYDFASLRFGSFNSLPIEKTLTFHNVIILIKTVVNNNENNYYYNMILEKGSYKDKPNTYFLCESLYIINAIFP